MRSKRARAWFDEFKFDFNEQAEPCEELHRMRVAQMKHFNTLEAYHAHLRKMPSTEDILAELDRRIAAKKKLEQQPAKRTVRPRTRGRKMAVAT